MIEILVYVPTREEFIQGMTSTYLPDGTPLATITETGSLLYVPGLHVDEIGNLVKKESVFVNGIPTTPPEIVYGHHVNILIAGGALEELLTEGMPTEGNVFERTRILSLIPGLVWEDISRAGEPPGYVGPNNVKLFDPANVKNRRRIWA
jgi:hypothetical protein